MDETPVYMDMVGSTTIDFKGGRNVDGAHTGHEKSRFTVVMCSSMSGRLTKTMVIFKGLKNVPKCEIPANIHVAVSKGGSMKEPLMLEWLDKCFRARGSFFATTKSLLLMDNHLSHNRESVLKACRQMNVTVKLIPAKTTSFLQPLDVGANGPFKAGKLNFFLSDKHMSLSFQKFQILSEVESFISMSIMLYMASY
jgi:hypothetical protein